ncbi:MAG: hypothetical protein GEU74_08605 [Nitriliruptorales bacterium]|nr:hypothetical protein [Nitriliruptorales bacterium]
MRTPPSRAAGGVLVAMLLAWLAMPMAAAAAATAKNVTNADEAWFLRSKEPLAELPDGDPTCDIEQSGCNLSGSAQRPNPHPEGVLVVAANSGEPDAQTFFTFDLQQLPLGAMVTGGKVTLPVARDPDARNVRAEAARMVACMTTGFVPAGTDAGSYNERPAFDKKSCVEVKKEKDDPLIYSVNLERFGKAWGSGALNNGITLMVDPAITPPAPDQTWRVAFNSHRRSQQMTEAEKEKEAEETRLEFPAITSTLEYKVEKIPDLFADFGGSTGAPPGGDGDFEDTSGGDFSTGDTGVSDTSGAADFGSSGDPATGGEAIAPPVDNGVAPVDAPVTAGAPGGQPVAGTVPAAANPGLSPAVWVTPLLALTAAAAMAWSLMQPVDLVGQREGAVSRLMRSRRAAADNTSTPS